MSVAREIRAGVRVARRAPWVSLGAVLCLALGIGATTALYGVLQHIVLRPLAYPAPSELVLIRTTNRTQSLIEMPVSYVAFRDWRERAADLPLREIEAYRVTTLALSGIAMPERLDAGWVSDGFFRTLGVVPIEGRTLGPADAQPGAPPAAVISERLWRRQFNADPFLVGRTLTLNARPVTIVGIIPAAFRDPYGQQQDCWTPFPAGDPSLKNPDVRTLVVIARLEPGATLEAARAAMQTPPSSPDATAVTASVDRWDIDVLPLVEHAAKAWREPAIALFVAVLLVLLIACTNVGTLLLARASDRSHELALRLALGAGPAQLARQLTLETLVLATPGAMGGLLCAYGLQQWLIVLRPAFLSRIDDMRLDTPALVVTIVCTTVTAALCTSLPLWHALRGPRQELLRGGASGMLSSGMLGGATLRRSLTLLTIAEIALGVTLLLAATMVTRNVLARLPQEPFDWRDRLTVRVSLPPDRYQSREERLAFLQRAADQLRALPGVTAVATASITPFDRYMLGASVSSGTSRDTTLAARPATMYAVVSPEYFATLGITLPAGRAFTAQDTFGAPGAFIVNETLARRLWPGRAAIGQPLAINVFNPSGSLRGDVKRDGHVVGVVPDIRHPGVDDVGPLIYAPVAQHTLPFARLIVAAPRVAALARDVRLQVGRLDPTLVPDEVKSLEEMVAQGQQLSRFYMALTQLFAAIGLTLVVVGVYAITGYVVHRRRRELAVRAALGASPRQLFSQVVGHGVIVIVTGLIAGAGAAWLARRLIAALLVGPVALDPGGIAIAAAVVILAAGAATTLGALRAVRLDPIRALREP
jgi:putative ABC transport system permease protein